ncbi:MAG TPA: type IV toxin-antitoxin system AbiEi family antitoxin domain-containing protein, partial [Egibacteraceae bacterium]|nr:type IV toxin-antitoxin system AbiEi family antitoxin domain-containing protein [Egibacteraceae bacterium]
MDPWERLASLARRQHGVVSVEQAAAMGICSRTLGRRVNSAAWDRPHRGTYGLPGAVRTYRYAVSAAVLAAGPGALAAGRTA